MSYQIIFTSAATRRMRPQDLAQLMQATQERHRRYDVTGLLLFCSGTFLQVLEGARADLKTLYQQIEAEDYHHGLTIIRAHEIAEREFDTWAMGFCETSEAQINAEIDALGAEEDVPAYSHFMDESKTVGQLRKLAHKPSFAYETLMRFKGR